MYFLLKENYNLRNLLDSKYYFMEILSVINAIIAVFLSVWILGLINKQLRKVLEKAIESAKNKYYSLFLESTVKFIKIVKYLIAFYIWLQLLIVPTEFDYIISKIFKVSFILVLLLLWNSLINAVFKWLIKNKKWWDLSKQVYPMLSRILIVFMWIIWWLTIIWNLGYNISALITWAWVWWLALALAAQKSVSNIFWAISIIINKPFKVWEYVRINWFTWKVKEIGLTYLEVRDASWNKILIPNENLISTAIENLTQRDNRRTDFSVWVVYETTIEKLKKWVEIIEDILKKYVEEWTMESYRVNFDSFWDFSLNINATYFSLVNDDYTLYLKQKESINFDIKTAFEKEKISMAFPTQEVIIRK